MTTKHCSKCKEYKPLSEFYRLHNYCKMCLRAYNKANPRQKKAYLRQHADDRIRKIYENSRMYNKKRRAENPVKANLYSHLWQIKNREKRNAHQKVAYAIKAGKLKKKPCQICGAARVHAHHSDYSLPLKVQWLCPVHHQLAHQN